MAIPLHHIITRLVTDDNKKIPLFCNTHNARQLDINHPNQYWYVWSLSELGCLKKACEAFSGLNDENIMDIEMRLYKDKNIIEWELMSLENCRQDSFHSAMVHVDIPVAFWDPEKKGKFPPKGRSTVKMTCSCKTLDSCHIFARMKFFAPDLLENFFYRESLK